MSIEINISPRGQVGLEESQQEWFGEDSQIRQTALFAGHQMVLSRAPSDDSEAFSLEYLGLIGTGFQSMTEAKLAAPAFAKEVLTYLSRMIEDD